MPESFLEPTAQNASAWSDAELTSAVQAYVGMLYAELAGKDYSKAEVNRQLREGPLAGRTKGSIEFRMQNISAALYELKMPRIAGYLPAKNIGGVVPTSDRNSLAKKVTLLRNRHLGKIPTGTSRPAVSTSTTTTFVRDPAVKAWVLQTAEGMCEGCDYPAPFFGQDGFPYLEVHHVMPLSSHGSDTTTNAAALCPNCHRRCHFSADRDEFKLELYRQIPRLILEVPESATAETDEFIHIG
jgi:5-methylcytosine-specific restriction protein A